MPKPTPEVQQAQANFKAAQQALQAATFAQWEAGGVPVGMRFGAALLGLAVGMMLATPFIMFWTDYLFQQRWAAQVQHNPRLSHFSEPHRSWTSSFVFWLLPFTWIIAFRQPFQLLRGYPQACKTLAILGSLGVLLGIVVSYLISRPLFAPI